MARLVTAGAELQSPDSGTEGFATGGVVGAFTISTTQKRSGEASYEITAAAVNAVQPVWTAVSGRTFYTRAWLRLSALPGVTRVIARVRNGGIGLLDITCSTAGALAYAGAGSGSLGSVTAGQWFCLEISVNSTATGSSFVVRIDGTQVATPAIALANQLANNVVYGNLTSTVDATWKVNIDDVAVNDDQGSAQATWPGVRGHVVLLRPAADSAIGTNWKLGTGTAPTANAFDAIDNIPPLGVTNGATGADAKQIRNAVNANTAPDADADVTLEAYDVRVPGGSTVRVVQSVAMLSATAGSQSVEYGLVSNPSETRATSTPSSPATTFPANWTKARGTPVTDPTVTQSQGPVMRARKATASSSTVMCCFIGLMVEFDASLFGVLTGVGDIAIGATAGNLSGTANLSASAGITFTPLATLKRRGSLAGTSTMTVTGAVVPPTAKAHLTGTGAVHVDAAGALANRGRMIATTGLAVAAAVTPPTGTARLSSNPSFGVAAEVGLGKLLPARELGDFNARWHSGLHVGAAKPGQRVQVRAGRLNRRHATWPGEAIDVFIPGIDPAHNQFPWQAFWEPLSEYVDIPNVREVRLEKSTSNNGLTTATLTIDNIFYRPELAGHHSIQRGHLAPLRGYVAPGRTRLTDEQGAAVNENEWFGLLSRQAQITVHQNYGDVGAPGQPPLGLPTFTGLVDDVDTTSRPDVITITLRCFGQVLTDERVFGWNKEPEIKDPVIFIDRESADKVTSVGDEAAASSELDAAHSADKVLDGDGDTAWRSAIHTTRGNTEYVEIRLPEGRYNDYNLNAEVGGMELYVSLLAKNLADGSPPQRNGADITDNVWQGDGSGNLVPGANGGIAFIAHVTGVSSGALIRSLVDEYVVGEGSILRVSFRNLGSIGPTSNYFAGVTSLKGRKRKRVAEAITQHWVLTQDVTDMVKQVLRWAGFKEWDVESAGVPLKKRYVVNRGMTYMDVVQKVAEVTGYTFFIADPTDDPASIGVPVFRRTLAVASAGELAALGQPVTTIRDSELLTAINVKQTDEPLAYIIRVRGRESSDGVPLGGSSTKRVMFTFRPPWSHQIGAPLADDRMGGVLKHVIHKDDLFSSIDDCKFGAYYIALQEALASVAAGIEFPAWPLVELDDQLELLDLATGVTSRLLVTTRASTFTRAGTKTTWTMTVDGALLDIPDVVEMTAIIAAARRS